MPDTDYAEKLRSINFGTPRKPQIVEGVTKVVEAINEDDGSTAGAHTFHADGRVGATVTPQPATVSMALTNKE